MRKFLIYMLLFFFVCGTFTSVIDPISAVGVVADSWYEKIQCLSLVGVWVSLR